MLMPKKIDDIVTKKYLEDTLDKRFAKQSQAIVYAVTEVVDKKIDALALKVAKGFEDTARKTDMDQQFKEVNNKLNKIENLIIIDHKKRIEKLETEMKELKAMLAM